MSRPGGGFGFDIENGVGEVAIDLAEIFFLEAGEDARVAGEREAEEEPDVTAAPAETTRRQARANFGLRANQEIPAAARARNRPVQAARNAMTASGAGKFMLLPGGLNMGKAPRWEVLCTSKMSSFLIHIAF